MEDTLRAMKELVSSKPDCLNPCFNGRYSQSSTRQPSLASVCLNPCFNGRYSLRATTDRKLYLSKVLILVLMEDTL